MNTITCLCSSTKYAYVCNYKTAAIYIHNTAVQITTSVTPFVTLPHPLPFSCAYEPYSTLKIQNY